MKKIVDMEVDLSVEEIEEFNRFCSESGVCPAQKLGELVHGFIIAEGVKHHSLASVRVA